MEPESATLELYKRSYIWKIKVTILSIAYIDCYLAEQQHLIVLKYIIKKSHSGHLEKKNRKLSMLTLAAAWMIKFLSIPRPYHSKVELPFSNNIIELTVKNPDERINQVLHIMILNSDERINQVQHIMIKSWQECHFSHFQKFVRAQIV